MNDLSHSLALLSKPYSLTRSRLGAITKVYGERYICDVNSLRELFHLIVEKLAQIQPTKPPSFSFLISFSDRTHQDGVLPDLGAGACIPIGKQTERIVMKWVISHEVDGEANELAITVRISNPINPLVFLQAALSKAPGDLDNFEFESGSTCATVDGAGHAYAEEIFLRIKNWLEARNKPHPFVDIYKMYDRFEWWIDEFNRSLLPFLAIGACSLYSASHYQIKEQLAIAPLLVALFTILRAFGGTINSKMAKWAHYTHQVSVFLVTNGDQDAVTKMAAKARNGVMKLACSGIASLLLNLLAGWMCWYFLERP